MRGCLPSRCRRRLRACPYKGRAHRRPIAGTALRRTVMLGGQTIRNSQWGRGAWLWRSVGSGWSWAVWRIRRGAIVPLHKRYVGHNLIKLRGEDSIPNYGTASSAVQAKEAAPPQKAFDDFRRLGLAADERDSLGPKSTGNVWAKLPKTCWRC